MKFKDFIEYEMLRLNEMPIARKGDWSGDNKIHSLFGLYSETIINKYWKKFKKVVVKPQTLEALPNFEFRYLKKDNEINCIGGIWVPREDTKDFLTIISLVLIKSPIKIKNKELWRTSRVAIKEEKFRGKKFAESLYSTIIESGFNIVCDTFQFDGARKLWKNLSKNYRVSVYNSFDKEITKEPHLIINTDFENLDDEWSREIDLEHTHLLFVIYK